jgi:transcriptional regulator with XRE-family HTH domain
MSKLLVVRASTEIDQHATALKARNLRHNKGVSLRELAKLLKLSAGYLSDLELARRKWSEKLADKVEAALR